MLIPQFEIKQMFNKLPYNTHGVPFSEVKLKFPYHNALPCKGSCS